MLAAGGSPDFYVHLDFGAIVDHIAKTQPARSKIPVNRKLSRE